MAQLRLEGYKNLDKIMHKYFKSLSNLEVKRLFMRNFLTALFLLVACTAYGFPVNTNTGTFDPSDVVGNYNEFRWEWGGYEDQFIQADFKDVVVSNVGFRVSYPQRGSVYFQSTDFTVVQTTIVTEVLEIFTNTYPKIVGTNFWPAASNVTRTFNYFVDFYTNNAIITTSVVVDSSSSSSNTFFTNSIATSIVFTGTGTFTTVPDFGIYTNTWNAQTSTITFVTNEIFINALGSNFVKNSEFSLSVTNWILGTNSAYAASLSSVTNITSGTEGSVYQGFSGLSVGETYRYYFYLGTFNPTFPSHATINMAGNTSTVSKVGYVVLTNTAKDASGVQITFVNTDTVAWVDDVYVQPFKEAVTNDSQGIDTNIFAASNLVITLFPENIHTNTKYSISSQAVTRATLSIDRTNVPPVNTYFAEFLGYEGAVTSIPTRILAQGRIPVFRSLYEGTNIIAFMTPSNTIGPPLHKLTDVSAWPFVTNAVISGTNSVSKTGDTMTGALTSTVIVATDAFIGDGSGLTNLAAGTSSETSTFAAVLSRGAVADTPVTNTSDMYIGTYYDIGNTNTGGDTSIAIGGTNNFVSAPTSVVGGGSENSVSGLGSSTIGGGYQNQITSQGWATIPGGSQNQAHGNYSLAAGRLGIANHDGSMVLADGTTNSKTSSGANTLNLFFEGGVLVNGTNIPSGGASTSTLESVVIRDGISGTPFTNQAAISIETSTRGLSISANAANDYGMSLTNLQSGGDGLRIVAANAGLAVIDSETNETLKVSNNNAGSNVAYVWVNSGNAGHYFSVGTPSNGPVLMEINTADATFNAPIIGTSASFSQTNEADYIQAGNTGSSRQQTENMQVADGTPEILMADLDASGNDLRLEWNNGTLEMIDIGGGPVDTVTMFRVTRSATVATGQLTAAGMTYPSDVGTTGQVLHTDGINFAYWDDDDSGGGSGPTPVYTNGTGTDAIMPVGGSANVAGGTQDLVMNGQQNEVISSGNSVAGGVKAKNYGNASWVFGNDNLLTNDIGGTIVGGKQHYVANTRWASIGGGLSNTISGVTNGTISGGEYNKITAAQGSIPGGRSNLVSGVAGWAGGLNASALHDNSFVWSDGSANATSLAANTFSIYASGGAYVNGSIVATGTPLYTAGAGSLTNVQVGSSGYVANVEFVFADNLTVTQTGQIVNVAAAGGGGGGGIVNTVLTTAANSEWDAGTGTLTLDTNDVEGAGGGGGGSVTSAVYEWSADATPLQFASIPFKHTTNNANGFMHILSFDETVGETQGIFQITIPENYSTTSVLRLPTYVDANGDVQWTLYWMANGLKSSWNSNDTPVVTVTNRVDTMSVISYETNFPWVAGDSVRFMLELHKGGSTVSGDIHTGGLSLEMGTQ